MARSRFQALVPADQTRDYGPANKYDEEHCWTVRTMAQEGMFPEEWCAELGVTLPTLYNWANAYPEFEQAVHEAWWLLRAFWTKKARDSIQGVGMPPSVLMSVLEKRFPDTWGKNPRNTHETFERRNEVEASDTAGAQAIRDAKTTDIEARIKELEARRKHEES